MATICTRCALRLQRAGQPSPRVGPKRSITSTPTRRKGIPTFAATSQPELDDAFLQMRTKQFIPAALSKPERRLIFGTKFKQQLEDNPQTVTIGEEDIALTWIDRRNEVPNRRKLLNRIVKLMASGEKSDWNNLPAFLSGLKRMKKEPNGRQMGKIIRLAVNSGRFGAVLQCLHQAHNTGMTLKNQQVLEAVVWGLHQIAQDADWSKDALEKAIKDANEVAKRLEDEEHGSGRMMKDGDPRRRPEVLGVYLELVAVYAWKYQDQKDVDGKVKAYAERLLSNIGDAEKPATTSPVPIGPQTEVLRGVPIWHGLSLAQKMLGNEMPKADLARTVVDDWAAGLTTLTQAIEAREESSKPGSYGDQALRVWQECIHD